MNRILKLCMNLQKGQHVCQIASFQSRTIYNGSINFQKEQQNSRDGSQPRKKTKVIPKITLIGQNQAITITSLEEAQKLAKRRDLQLIKIQQIDSKTQRPVYKLVTAADMLSEEMQEFHGSSKSENNSQISTLKKSEKSLTMGARISENDLSSRLKNIGKWLTKNHEVRVLLQGSQNEMAACEKIYQTIEKFVKEPEVIGKIVNKRNKGANVKFSIIPLAKPRPTETKFGEDGGAQV